MLFNSLQYVVFLPVVLALYYLLPHKFRWILLLIASYFFYMCWNVTYALLIMISTVVTYFSGMLISKQNDRKNSGEIDDDTAAKNKKLFVALSLIINLGILAFFKYSPMVLKTIQGISDAIGHNTQVPQFSFLLPVGISFYTFQALSYTMDVYREKIGACHHFGKYALFVSFFPQLVAGPIERSTNLLPQFDEVKKFDLVKGRKAFLLILWGLFKKIVIADRVAVAVQSVYADVTVHNGVTIAFATFLFAIQVYCDFSAYSDIAIGSANLMGFDLMKNFDRPYFSKSIGEFWRRWHISLSTWFKDYLYIPLGGSRVSKSRWAFNVMVVFTLSGLWHGADWTYVIWGSLHGVYQVIGRFTQKYRDNALKALHIKREWKIMQLVSMAITFWLFCYALMIFRCNDIPQAAFAAVEVFKLNGEMFNLTSLLASAGMSMNDFLLSFATIFLLLIIQIVQGRTTIGDLLEKAGWPVRWVVYFALIFGTILLGLYGVGDAAFIYFQF